MNVFDIILCAIGILLLLESFLAKTKDVPSTIIIKIIPFFCGAYCLIYACMNSGFIKIGWNQNSIGGFENEWCVFGSIWATYN